MVYNILPYTKKRAIELGVKVFPSEKKDKKIEVYNLDGTFISYIGSSKYLDFPNYLEMEKQGLKPKGYANERRRLYHLRHNKEQIKLGDKYIGSPSYYAKELLW